MRQIRGRAAALYGPVLLIVGLALFAGLRDAGGDSSAEVESGGDGGGAGPADAGQDRFTAFCRTTTKGSHATASCHNPYPLTDRVRLHIECRRWWDLDVDSGPVEVGPAGYVRITDRCWKEIGSVWVSHERVAG